MFEPCFAKFCFQSAVEDTYRLYLGLEISIFKIYGKKYLLLYISVGNRHICSTQSKSKKALFHFGLSPDLFIKNFILGHMFVTSRGLTRLDWLRPKNTINMHLYERKLVS